MAGGGGDIVDNPAMGINPAYGMEDPIMESGLVDPTGGGYGDIGY